MPNLTALRLVNWKKNGVPLAPADLAALGAAPPRLRYIHWDVSLPPVTYVIECRDGLLAGRSLPGLPLPRKGDWTADSVLDHLAEPGQAQL